MPQIPYVSATIGFSSFLMKYIIHPIIGIMAESMHNHILELFFSIMNTLVMLIERNF